MGCEKFCANGANGRFGLIANPRTDLNDVDVTQIFGNNTGKCPFGCVANPKTKKATLNFISNSGKYRICHKNQWREELPG
jgi:hypothetical protein